MRPRDAIAVSTTLLILLAMSARAAESPSTSPTAGPAAAPAGTPEKPPAEAAAAHSARPGWWNQPTLVKALDLKDEQRAKMDALMAKALEQQHDAQAKQMTARQQFEDALGRGDWQAARTAATDLRQQVANAFGTQPLFKVDVLSLLTAQQRETLIKDHGPLLRRPWLSGMPMRGSRFRPMPPAPPK